MSDTLTTIQNMQVLARASGGEKLKSEQDAVDLSGGNITQVVRIGKAVHRTTGPWSTTVHGLLRHLAA